MLIWTQTHIPKQVWCLLRARLRLVYSQVFWLFVLVWMKLQSDCLFSVVNKHKWSHNPTHMNNMSQEFALLSVGTFLLLQSIGWTQQQPTLLALSWRWMRHNNWLCLSSTLTPPVFDYFWISWHLGGVSKIQDLQQPRPPMLGFRMYRWHHSCYAHCWLKSVYNTGQTNRDTKCSLFLLYAF